MHLQYWVPHCTKCGSATNIRTHTVVMIYSVLKTQSLSISCQCFQIMYWNCLQKKESSYFTCQMEVLQNISYCTL